LHEWITESHSFKLGKIRASSALAGSLVYFLSYNSSIGLIYWFPRLFRQLISCQHALFAAGVNNLEVVELVLAALNTVCRGDALRAWSSSILNGIFVVSWVAF